MTTTTNPASSRRGIDVRDALSILSARPKGGSSARDEVTDELRRMGQTLRIAGDDGDGDGGGAAAAAGGPAGDGGGGNDEGAASPTSAGEREGERHEVMQRERERRRQEIRDQLKSMNAGELLGTVFDAQRKRVATYKTFEDGLATILASGNVTGYPSLCAKVTASFSVLSDAINAVKSSLLERDERRDITDAILQLQKAEGEKLNLTAALHLERLRLRNAELESQASSDGGDGTTTTELLRGGIRMLRQKIGGAVEEINEALEELRCIAADED